MTVQLYNHSDLGRMFSIDSATVGYILEKKEHVEPDQLLRAGRGASKFYALDKVEVYLKEHVRKREAKFYAKKKLAEQEVQEPSNQEPSNQEPSSQEPSSQVPQYITDLLARLDTFDRKLDTVLAALQSGAGTPRELVDPDLSAALDAALGKPVDVPAPPASTATEPRPERIKVFVLGLLPGQATMIANEFSDLDLRFTESGDSKRAAKMAAAVDATIVMGGFTDHATMSAVKGSGCKRVITLQGGLTRLRDTLTSLYVEMA